MYSTGWLGPLYPVRKGWNAVVFISIYPNPASSTYWGFWRRQVFLNTLFNLILLTNGGVQSVNIVSFTDRFNCPADRGVLSVHYVGQPTVHVPYCVPVYCLQYYAQPTVIALNSHNLRQLVSVKEGGCCSAQVNSSLLYWNTLNLDHGGRRPPGVKN